MYGNRGPLLCLYSITEPSEGKSCDVSQPRGREDSRSQRHRGDARERERERERESKKNSFYRRSLSLFSPLNGKECLKREGLNETRHQETTALRALFALCDKKVTFFSFMYLSIACWNHVV